MTALAAESSEALLQEIADRMAVRRLVDLYAHCADRRDAEGQAALFAEDARLAVYQGDPAIGGPVQLLQGRAELTSALDFPPARPTASRTTSSNRTASGC